MGSLLVVEDDRHQRLILTEELQDEGYDVRTAANATEALAKVSATKLDLVVLDLGMPGMDGIELLGKLLEINKLLPIVIYTAYSRYQDNFMSWAADAYVLKQSGLGELKDTIREVLDSRGSASRRATAGLQLSGA